MSTTSAGHAAEALARTHLEALGMTILDQNWRNRWCEIDLVAKRGHTVHIVEVKYRHNPDFGHAADYVGRDKISRLRRAALAWVHAREHSGPYQIDMVTVEGELDRPAINYLPNCIQ